MAQLLKLEDFGTVPGAPAPPQDAALLPEEARLAAYEDGYKAGWDDASTAAQSSRDHVGAALGKNLEDLSFTFAEARQHVLGGIAPLLTLMAEKILPDLAQEMFAQTVLEQAMKAAELASDQPLELAVNPEHQSAIESLLGEAPAVPLTVQPDPTLGPGQAFLRHGTGETSVDIATLCDAISEAVAGFLNQTTKETQHVG